MKLYDYFRSAAAYRVRIALNLKNLEVEHIPVHLRRGGGEQFRADYAALNPQKLVPTLIDGANRLIQSMAIIEYLEEIHPEPPLLPAAPLARARVRALAQIVACDIHPINNLRVRLHLTGEMGLTEEAAAAWTAHWIAEGLSAYESLVADDPATGAFSHGDAPSLADICLVPQLANARMNKCDLGAYPKILAIEAACQALPAFEKALPANQADAEA